MHLKMNRKPLRCERRRLSVLLEGRLRGVARPPSGSKAKVRGFFGFRVFWVLGVK